MAEDKQLTPEQQIAALEIENAELKKSAEEMTGVIAELNQAVAASDEAQPAEALTFKYNKATYTIKAKKFSIKVDGAYVQKTAEDVKSDKELQKLLIDSDSGLISKKD